MSLDFRLTHSGVNVIHVIEELVKASSIFRKFKQSKPTHLSNVKISYMYTSLKNLSYFYFNSTTIHTSCQWLKLCSKYYFIMKYIYMAAFENLALKKYCHVPFQEIIYGCAIFVQFQLLQNILLLNFSWIEVGRVTFSKVILIF